MTQRKVKCIADSKMWIPLSALGWMAVACAALITGPIKAIGILLFVGSLLIAVALFRESRLAWALMLGGMGAEFVSALTRSDLTLLLIAIGVIVGLLAPGTTKEIWGDQRRGAAQPDSTVPSPRHAFTSVILRVLTAAERWYGARVSPDSGRNYPLLLWRLGVAIVFLFLGLGVFHQWKEDAGDAAFLCEIVLDLIWVGLVGSVAAFAAVLCLAGQSRRKRSR